MREQFTMTRERVRFFLGRSTGWAPSLLCEHARVCINCIHAPYALHGLARLSDNIQNARNAKHRYTRK